MLKLLIPTVLAATLVAGCNDTTRPRDVTPPAAPRGVTSVTGDGTVYLYWLANTEPDVTLYRVYEAPCASGPDCPYDRVGSTSGTSFTVTGLTNGETRYFAVSAVDRAGNESDLSYNDVPDTPRPEGYGATLNNYLDTQAGSGWDFSAYAARAWDDARTDMFFGDNGSIAQMFVPDYQTDIQDAGFASSLDAVDFAPSAGWSPTGSVELIVGHCYVVWTRTDNYAKFQVKSVSPTSVTFDWAYQVATGIRELRARPAVDEDAGARRPVVWLR